MFINRRSNIIECASDLNKAKVTFHNWTKDVQWKFFCCCCCCSLPKHNSQLRAFIWLFWDFFDFIISVFDTENQLCCIVYVCTFGVNRSILASSHLAYHTYIVIIDRIQVIYIYICDDALNRSRVCLVFVYNEYIEIERPFLLK